MRPAWRLAINNLSGRRSRTLLLIAATALSASLIVAVACAMSSMQNAVRMRIESTVGAADLRITHIGGSAFDQSVLGTAAAWPEVAFAVGRAQGPSFLTNQTNGRSWAATMYGIEPEAEERIRPRELAIDEAGRVLGVHLGERDDQIVLDELAAEKLGASVGDLINVQSEPQSVQLIVAGIVKRPPLGMLAWAECMVRLPTFWRIVGRPDQIMDVSVVVRDGVDANIAADAARRRADLPASLLVQVTEKITSGLEKNMQSSRLGMLIGTVMSFLCATFIITTGLTTGVTERQRELAVVRCIGGTRSQLAAAQLLVGLIIGAGGAAVGIPIGVGGAAALVSWFPDQLPGGFGISWFGVALAGLGSLGAGLAGAAWPAWRASTTSPLMALASRAASPTRRGVLLCLAAGVCGALFHIGIFTLLSDPDVIFWTDMTVGLPTMCTGYFLLAVPMMVVTTLVFGPAVSRALRLPGTLLKRTVLATPYRHGFTAGAMMAGLSLHVSIWSNGRAITYDWLESLDFPDAFVNGFNLSEKTRERIESLPFVDKTCAVTLQSLETDAFGVKGLADYRTTFLAFEPAPFFAMTRVRWIEGDPVTAQAKLEAGGAILVAREFKITRGYGVGDVITLTHEGTPHDFEIVGVVTSPGLDIVSKYFDIGAEYAQMSVNSVMGSRDDLKRLFGNDAINLIQMDFKPGTNDSDAVREVRRAVGFGVISCGSGGAIKEDIRMFLTGSLRVFSAVAVAAMLVACFGVANLIVAGVQARRFELGVLRAIGAERALLARLILGEALLIALAACLLGTVMGMQGAWAGSRMYEELLGLLLPVRLPVTAVLIGWGILAAITLAAAVPAALTVLKASPRELLGAVKG